MQGGGRTVYVVLLTIISAQGLPLHGQASQLAPPAAGPQDASLAGNTVALPLNAASALFHNPAQLTLLPNSVTMGLLGIR